MNRPVQCISEQTSLKKASYLYYSILTLTKLKCLILRWCRARDLFGSQIPVNTGGFELWISCRLGNYFVCKRFTVQTLLWSLEFAMQINLERDTIAVWNLARSWSISKYFMSYTIKLHYSRGDILRGEQEIVPK